MLSYAIDGPACLAADLGDWHRAAVLHGAAHALLDQMGARMTTFDARRREENLDQISAALGDESLRQAYTEGTALGFDHVIDLALGKSSPP